MLLLRVNVELILMLMLNVKRVNVKSLLMLKLMWRDNSNVKSKC